MNQTFERKHPSPAERAARKAFKEVDAVQVMTEHEKAQEAFNANRERLKAERLARETQGSKRLSDKPAGKAGRK